MKKLYNISIFIFRRDLRIADNTGLLSALKESDKVIPLFICTPKQISNSNKLKSSNAIQFMIESLYDLDNQINSINKSSRLWIIYDDEIAALKKILNKIKYDAIYINEDYTPYSIQRDKRIKIFCRKNAIDLNTNSDLLLLGNEDISANNGNRYIIFSQFYKKCLQYKIKRPNKKIYNNFAIQKDKFKKWRINEVDKFILKKGYYKINEDIAMNGGRYFAIKILKNISKFKNYKNIKDIVSKHTTMLSAHNKFGTVSIREVYYAFKNKARSSELCKQLYWRDFYYYIGRYFKNMYKYEHLRKPHKKKNIQPKWDNNKKFFKKWANGETGFPIVDAAMRQLNITGYMHNRCRLITGNFLSKDLLIDWRYGEKYFAKKLVDYDRALNMGNWNWVSSFGLDATIFLRILNPWTQSIKFDPECLYIKKWLPELIDVPPKHIHQWFKFYGDYSDINYPKPIVKHDQRQRIFREFYKKYFK